MLDQLLSTELLLNASIVAEAGILSYLWSALVSAIILIACAYILPGVHIDSFVSALILAVIVGGVVALVGSFLPGLGYLGGLAVTTLALILGDNLMESVRLDAWWWALVVAVIVGLFGWLGTLF